MLVMVDLDNFKRVNETQGREAGDLLLREVAARLTRCTRAGDTVARMNGNEFTLLLDSLDGPEEETRAIAGRVLEELAAPVSLPLGR